MLDQVTHGRRSSLEIAYDILSLCDNDGGVNKTSIMYQCNLSYTLLQRYLSSMDVLRVIRKDTKGQVQTTPKGQRVLEQMKEMVRFLRDLRYAVNTTAELTPV